MNILLCTILSFVEVPANPVHLSAELIQTESHRSLTDSPVPGGRAQAIHQSELQGERNDMPTKSKTFPSGAQALLGSTSTKQYQADTL